MSGGGGNGGKKRRSPRIGGITLGHVGRIFDDVLTGNIGGAGKELFDAAVQPYDEPLGEVTGRNQTRDALREEDKRVAAEAAAAAREEANRRLQEYRKDLASSRAAQATRNTAASRSNAKYNGGGPGQQKLGSDDKDFLGV